MGILLLLFQFLPLILRSVVAVEETVHIDNGQDKKKVIFDSVISALQALTGNTADNKTMNILSVLTDATVKTLKTVGAFTSKDPIIITPQVLEVKQ